MDFISHSQAGQDRFAFEMTEHKRAGSFLDIGCHDAQFHNNTYALEEYYDWRGILVDIVSGCENRKSTFIQCDAANPNERLKFHYSLLPDVVDFLSLDADRDTFGAFTAIPWPKVTFRVICLEHDSYRFGTELRDKLRSMLKAMSYELVCADVMVRYPEYEPPKPFEDWYVMPLLVNSDLIVKYTCEGKLGSEIVAL